MNDARNVRRSQKMSYATIRSWGTVSATIKTCSIPSDIRVIISAYRFEKISDDHPYI
jgi:hypothetical protein